MVILGKGETVGGNSTVSRYRIEFVTENIDSDLELDQHTIHQLRAPQRTSAVRVLDESEPLCQEVLREWHWS